MRRNAPESFFAQIRWKLFKRHISREIHDRMMAHLQHEKDWGYPFRTAEEMNAQTEALDVQPVLETIEEHIQNMPKGYGACFRHILHRDLHERIRMFEQVARRNVRRTCDPRFVATHA